MRGFALGEDYMLRRQNPIGFTGQKLLEESPAGKVGTVVGDIREI